MDLGIKLLLIQSDRKTRREHTKRITEAMMPFYPNYYEEECVFH